MMVDDGRRADVRGLSGASAEASRNGRHGLDDQESPADRLPAWKRAHI